MEDRIEVNGVKYVKESKCCGIDLSKLYIQDGEYEGKPCKVLRLPRSSPGFDSRDWYLLKITQDGKFHACRSARDSRLDVDEDGYINVLKDA